MKPQTFALPYINLITEQEAKFLLEHSEKMLKDTLDTNTLILSRVTNLTTVTSTLMIALFGYSLSRYVNQVKLDNLLLTAVIGLAYLFFIAILLFKNVRPNAYYSVGSEPMVLFTSNVFNERNRDYRMIVIYVNEIHEYQNRIAHNKSVNEKRWELYKIALILVVLTPVALTITYLLLRLFRC